VKSKCEYFFLFGIVLKKVLWSENAMGFGAKRGLGTSGVKRNGEVLILSR